MGRGRGKGKKPATVGRDEDPESEGEEHNPSYKRRGGSPKSLPDDADKEEIKRFEENDDDSTPKEEKGKKRKRYLQVKDDFNTNLEDKATNIRSKLEETTKTNGFRHNGSRRKSKPHRAAEAVVPVAAVYKGF
ncbi:hypothetical protein KSP40_PGU012521 [Platanthera guangdongensis]|uniref:Uncharacterized protein n=1 Tax=Platanthera guangdongensis TaxID=2320717 RepID=A0ABR2LYH9_9ASPA